MLEIILSLIFIVLTTFFLYYLACIQTYWKNRGIPGPTGKILWGNLLDLTKVKYPPLYQIRDWTKKYGKFYGIREGWRHVLIVSDPDMVQEFLVKKFEYFHGRRANPLVGNVDKERRAHVFNARGARWKRLRNIASPSFSTSNLKKIMPVVDDSTKVMMTHLDKAAASGKAFNMHPYFHELTMDIIQRIALGQHGTRQFDNPNVEIVKQVFANIGTQPINKLAWLVPWEWVIWTMRRFMSIGFVNRPLVTLITNLYKEVEERKKLRAEGKITYEDDRIDFIDLFLDAESMDIDEPNGNYDHKSPIKVSKKMTTDEIVGQCFVFLLAGFDTTANTLAFTTYYLAKNPDKQKILQDEIDEMCPNDEVSYEQMQSLKYADAVMKEALRMVPIASNAASRECMETTTLGNITIEKGTYVWADTLTLHYDKELWGDDADKFVPERWLDNESRHPASWIPFGGGPRTCIGMRLAYMEEKLALVRILKEYDIVECEETEKNFKIIGVAVLNPESVSIKLVKRKKN